MRAALRKAGFAVTEAECGADALRAFGEGGTFFDQSSIPARPILLFEEDDGAVLTDAGGGARPVEEHQGQEAIGIGRGLEGGEQPGELHRAPRSGGALA